MTLLPTFDDCLQELSVAEQGDGWLVACEDDGTYLVVCRELIAALSDALPSGDAAPVLEVCAGSGALAAALGDAGISVLATDANPADDAAVERADAEEAMRRYRPSVVLAAFAPVDSGVDQVVMHGPTVREYVVLGARIGGQFGSLALRSNSDWEPTPLVDVTRWMITRHDVGLPTNDNVPRIIHHGEAWRLRRL